MHGNNKHLKQDRGALCKEKQNGTGDGKAGLPGFSSVTVTVCNFSGCVVGTQVFNINLKSRFYAPQIFQNKI